MNYMYDKIAIVDKSKNAWVWGQSPWRWCDYSF